MSFDLTADAWSRIQTARERLTKVNRELRDAIQTARSHTDEHLTNEGLAAKRAELREQAQAKYQPQLEQLRAQIKSDSDTLTKAAEEARPQVAGDAASLMRAQTRWDQARMKLEAGMTLREVIAAANSDELLALREWAPTWMTVQARAEHPPGFASGPFEAPDTKDIIGVIDGRLAEVAGGRYGSALTKAREAAETAAYAEPLLSHLELEASGSSQPGGAMQAAVDAHYAAQLVHGDPTAVDAGAGEADSSADGGEAA